MNAVRDEDDFDREWQKKKKTSAYDKLWKQKKKINESE